MDIAIGRREVYSEVLEVLRHMSKVYIDKIPKKLIMFFYDNCSLDYEFRMTKRIGEENLRRETLEILAVLDLNYWSSSKKTKEDIVIGYALGSDMPNQNKLNSQLEQENVFTKIEVTKQEEEDSNPSNLPAVISTSLNITKKILVFIKDLIIKIFGD